MVSDQVVDGPSILRSLPVGRSVDGDLAAPSEQLLQQSCGESLDGRAAFGCRIVNRNRTGRELAVPKVELPGIGKAGIPRVAALVYCNQAPRRQRERRCLIGEVAPGPVGAAPSDPLEYLNLAVIQRLVAPHPGRMPGVRA